MLTKFELYHYDGRSKEKLFKYFDKLQPIDKSEMVGYWRTYDIDTHHVLNSFLRFTNWYGKIFFENFDTHGIIFRAKSDSNKLIKVSPYGFPFAASLPNNDTVSFLFNFVVGLFSTKKPTAKIRNVSFRGKNSAALVYNKIDVIDYYRRIDNDTVLAVLLSPIYNNDPFFFIMEKEKKPTVKFHFISKKKDEEQQLNMLKQRYL